MRKKKSNISFGIGAVIIVVLLLQLVKACNRYDWLDSSKPKTDPKVTEERIKKLLKEVEKKNK